MGSCTWFGAGSGDWGYRERESVAVLSGGELDRGRGAAMWVSPHMQGTGLICASKISEV